MTARTYAAEDASIAERAAEIARQKTEALFACSCEWLIGTDGQRIPFGDRPCPVHRPGPVGEENPL